MTRSRPGTNLTSCHLATCTSTPSARTAWHAHTIAQTLYVTGGEGWVQSPGHAVIKIRPGDAVTIAGHEWHWHGPTPDHPMTHLSLTVGGTE